MNLPLTQKTILFTLPHSFHPPVRMEEPEWRAKLSGAGLPGFDSKTSNAVRVVAVRDMLWLIAATPVASAALESRIDDYAAAIAAVAGAPVPFVERDRRVGVRSTCDQLCGYRIPRYVVAKGSGAWAQHFDDTLPETYYADLGRRIGDGVRRELAAWGRLPAVLDAGQPLFVVSLAGRPMVLKAIRADRSGHGKAVSVLVRANVTLLSYLQLEGDLFAGPLSSLGFGRLLRGSPPPEMDIRLQERLADLPDPSMEYAQ